MNTRPGDPGAQVVIEQTGPHSYAWQVTHNGVTYIGGSCLTLRGARREAQRCVRPLLRYPRVVYQSCTPPEGDL